ncbi:MAG: response regulator [Rhodothermales bacterium]
MAIRIGVIEDQTKVREGLALIIDASEGYECLGRWGTAEAALEDLETLDLDVVLMDIGLPGMSGIEATSLLKARRAEVQVMMLTVYEDDDRIFESLRAGASGYILKKTPPTDLLDAIRDLHEGGSPMSGEIARRVVEAFRRPAVSREVQEKLTLREQEILALLVQNYRYREIADQLYISVDTVRTHIRHIYEKLHVHSRAEAVMKYMKPY